MYERDRMGSEKKKAELEGGKANNLKKLVEYVDGSVVSRTIKKSQFTTMTAFAFDKGQELSEHTAPFDAFVLVIDGKVKLVIGGKDVVASEGEIVLMPADIPHGVVADERFMMLLTMVKTPKPE